LTTVFSPAPAAEQLRERAASAVRDYYRETRWDFCLLWSGSDLHFGLYERPWTRHTEALRATNRLLADLAGIGPGSRVLDAGCGVGGCCLQLAGEFGAACTGITLVPAQADFAKRRASRIAGAGSCEFFVADYTRTRLPSASFDAVLATESLCHAPDKAAFYREAARLLRPGGRLVVAEYVRRADPLGADAERLLREWLEGWALPGLDTEDEHRRHALAAGFEDVRIEDRSLAFRRSLRRLYTMTAASYPLAWLGHTLGLRSRVQHGNVVGSLRAWQSLVRGTWFYATVTATRSGTPRSFGNSARADDVAAPRSEARCGAGRPGSVA
jgi:tocopherol O-methyltransferase